MSGDERELHLAWQHHVGAGDEAEHWFDTVLGAHRSPGRHYHDARHVRWVVRHGRELAATADLDETATDRVVAAAFFHDVVYHAMASDNEAQSAAMARRALGEIGWSAGMIDHVATMIDATAGHDPGIDDLATCVLLAADLGVLAAEPARYGDYVRNVRREYAHLDDRAWHTGRSTFIRSMLDQPTIFPWALHLDGWEQRARANLTAELAAMGPLRSGSGASGAHEP